jgi:predicted choloylglycine hydrolase
MIFKMGFVFRALQGLLKSLLFGLIALIFFTQCKIYTAYKDIVALHNEAPIPIEKGKPRLEYINSIPVLHVYGTPREMGLQYGTIMKKQLNSLVELSYELFPKKKIDEFVSIGQAASPNLPEKMMEELRGISEASGVDLKDLLAINLVPRTNCSTLAVWGKATNDGNLIMGRNADYAFKSVNRAIGLILVKHPSTGYATLTVTFLGMIGGYSCMNETGLSYGNMLVHNGTDKTFNTKGLSIQLIMQMAGEQFSTAMEMADFISKQTFLTSNNVMCADKNEAIVVECSQTQSEQRVGQKGVLAATNYFLSPGLYDEYVPCERFAKLMMDAKKNYGNYSVKRVEETMYHARRKGQNLQCVVFEPVTRTMYVSINKVPASKGPFTEFKIDDILKD